MDLLGLLQENGLETVVIGGCAVGAYARLLQEQVLSADLDLYSSRKIQFEILALVKREGAVIRKVPKVRSIPVLVFDWKGKEINILSAADGLRSPEMESLIAREFIFPDRPELPVLLGDPFDLLANKLTVNRPKDQAHIAILRRYLDGEVASAFEDLSDPRKRIGPAQRLMTVLRQKILPAELAARLVKRARTPVDFRFLMNHVPSAELAQALLDNAPEGIVGELAVIRQRRRFLAG